MVGGGGGGVGRVEGVVGLGSGLGVLHPATIRIAASGTASQRREAEAGAASWAGVRRMAAVEKRLNISIFMTKGGPALNPC